MGYDVTYHPINENEMQEWYFKRLDEIKQNNTETIYNLAKSFEIKDFYIDKYITTLRAGVTSLENGNEPFDKTHGFYVAVVQGFFRTYFYTRGSAFSFLFEEAPGFKEYTKSWQDILQIEINCPIQNRIVENYCSGVFIPYEQVKRLYEDYNNEPKVKIKLDELYSHGRIEIFLKAVHFCLDNELGLLEATEVAEPNPMDLNKSESFSDFFNRCDKEGPLLYRQAMLEQIAEIQKQSEDMKGKTIKEKGFFSKLFKK